MSWRDIFNIRVGTTPSIPGAAVTASTTGESKGTFITAQAIATFPGATFAIGVLWKLTEGLVPSLKGVIWVPFVIALIIGGFIYIVAITDPQANMTTREKLIGLFIGLFNSLYLFGSVAGILGALQL
jgi:hypothetical protein